MKNLSKLPTLWYLTKSKAKGLLDIPSGNTQIDGTQSAKYNCIRNNFRNDFPHIPLQKTSKRLFDWQILKVFFGSRVKDHVCPCFAIVC